MTDALQPNSGINALTTPISVETVPAGQVDSGSPTAGVHELLRLGDVEVGIWEHSPGVSTDVEANEVFVVLGGRGTVELVESGVVLHLEPGVVGRLAAGTVTRWTVTETLRKIYLA